MTAAENELQKLRAKTKADARRVGDLTTERNSLTSRLNDRNEELAGKNKLLEVRYARARRPVSEPGLTMMITQDVQDENLTLNMELTVTEQKAAKVAAENKELVERWMRRMAQEADAMNLANEPGINNGG